MLALLDPSRQDIPEYAEYLGAIQRTARVVNDRFQREGWMPIDLRIADDFPGSVAAYKQYDVLLVNAIFDGLNLVAKEAPLVNERDGVLVLSENAGAHEELQRVGPVGQPLRHRGSGRRDPRCARDAGARSEPPEAVGSGPTSASTTLPSGSRDSSQISMRSRRRAARVRERALSHRRVRRSPDGGCRRQAAVAAARARTGARRDEARDRARSLPSCRRATR